MSRGALVMAAGLPAPAYPQSGSLVTRVCSPLVLRRKERGPENRSQTPGRWPDLGGQGFPLATMSSFQSKGGPASLSPPPSSSSTLQEEEGGRLRCRKQHLSLARGLQGLPSSSTSHFSESVSLCADRRLLPQLISNFAPTEGKDTEPTAKLQAQRREAQTYSSTLLRWFRQP